MREHQEAVNAHRVQTVKSREERMREWVEVECARVEREEQEELEREMLLKKSGAA